MVLVKDGKILLGLRKSPHGNGTWSFPGGHLEMGEEPKDAAIRELKEETGIVINELIFSGLTNDVFPDGKHYITIFFIAKTKDEPQVAEPDKNVDWTWFDPGEFPTPLFLPVENLMKNNFIYANDELKDVLKI